MKSLLAAGTLLMFITGALFVWYGLFILAPPEDTEGMVYIPAGITMLFGLAICMVAASIHLFNEIRVRRGDHLFDENRFRRVEAVAGGLVFWIARVLFVLLALPLLLILAVIAFGLFDVLTQ